MYHRSITSNGTNLIKKYEGFRSEVYYCPGGFATIGFGHKILSNEKFDKITIYEAEEILLKDTKIYEKAVLRLIYVHLTVSQFDALVSFCFNLGSAALQRSSLRQKINRREYENAAYEFSKWVYVSGKKILGLVRRREEEANLFLQ